MAHQAEKAQRELITASHFNYCTKAVKAFTKSVGKDRPWTDLRPEDFAKYRMRLYDRYGVHAIERAITVVRALFKYAYDIDLIERPVKYGDQFNKPTAKEKRQHRSKQDRLNGKRLFTPGEIRLMIDEADDQLKAMILLGINGGFGNTDCAELPIAAVDLERAVIDYERPKTATPRVVPLWPETVAALRTVLEGDRPAPRQPEYAGLVFLTVFGNPWKKEQMRKVVPGKNPKGKRQETISPEFRKLLTRLKLRRNGIGFYALRHTFRTWADGASDQHAVLRIMGHTIPGMSGLYVEEIGIDRLRVITDLVRDKVLSGESKDLNNDGDASSNQSSAK